MTSFFFLFYVGFLSRTFTNHRTAGEGGRHFINSSLPLLLNSQTPRQLPGDYCRELTSAYSQQPDSNREPLVSERKSLTNKLRALLMNKSLRSVNLSLELHVVSTFLLESNASDTFSWCFVQSSLKLERPALKMHILYCRIDICSWKLSAKVSLMLDKSFPVPSLYKLNRISVCFIRTVSKITYRQLIPLSIPYRESHVFLRWSTVFWAAR